MTIKIICDDQVENIKLFNVILEAIDYIEQNLRGPISIQDITSRFEQSHWYFQRLFASVVGITIGQYVRERQLTEASLLLAEKNFRILDLAIEFGFGSEEAFSRSFKKFFGMSPSQCRKIDNLVLREARNAISKEKLFYFWKNVQRVPSIVKCPERLLVGSSIEFQSHFVLGSSCHLKIVPHWAKFKSRMDLIPHRSNSERIGAVLSSELDLREEKLTYFSGVEVTKISEFMEEMHAVVLPSGSYACFESRTLSEKNGHLIDYIYGIWLPSSGYQRGLGYDYEIFDHRYVAGDPNSVSRFFIPLTLSR